MKPAPWPIGVAMTRPNGTPTPEFTAWLAQMLAYVAALEARVATLETP